jgi:cobalt-zinc-cadmium efflux system outer membrane protein
VNVTIPISWRGGAEVRSLAAAVLLLLPTALSSAAQASGDGLVLDDVLVELRERSPRLHAMAAAADAAVERAPEASTLPDPMVQLGIMNFGIPDLNANMPMSMAPSVQLMQTVPFPGKLGMAGEIADIGSEMALARADEAWWEIRGRAAGLFYDLYSLDRRLEVMRETLLLLQDFQEVAKAMYGSGTGRQADVLRADVEVARMDGEIRRMEAMRVATAARLNALLDRPPSTTVESPRLGRLPAEIPDPSELEGWARESRPALGHARLGVDQARTRTELAARDIWPDVTLGLSYGQRDRGLGTERMGSAMLGFSLPIHARSRQHARRDEAAAMERVAAAELTARQAEVDARIGELLAELERARALSDLYRSEVVPEAHVNVESALSSYRVGAVDFMTLVDAQMSVNRYEGELYALLADYGRAVAALESAVGRTLPRTEPVLSEER